MELEYFNKYKEYYEALNSSANVLRNSEALASECTNLFEQTVSGLFTTVSESEWEESGKDIATNVVLNGLKDDFQSICNLINNNLVVACNIAINSLLPKINEIYKKNIELNNITKELYEYMRNKSNAESRLNKLSNNNNANGITYTTVINAGEERNKLNSLVYTYNKKINELSVLKEECINELNTLCSEANNYIIAILELDESLSDSAISARIPIYMDDQLNSFYEKYPSAKEMFNYYGPILQGKLGIIDTNIMVQMLMETYLALNADKDQNNIPKYGSFNAFLNAIANNCPDNYKDFNFNPNITNFSNLELGKKLNFYNLKNGFDDKYVITIEKININGKSVEIVQILPGSTNDYGEAKTSLTNLEQHFNNIYKANVINTVNNKIPVPVLESISSDTDIKFILTDENEVLLNNENNKGCPGLYDMQSGSICLEPIGMINSGDLSVDNVVAHQIGHKFDANYDNKSIHRNLSETVHEIFNSNVDALSYSSNTKDDRFYKMAQNNADKLSYIDNIFPTSNSFKKSTTEFFASSFDAYVNNEKDLITLCPEVHDAITQMINKTW